MKTICRDCVFAQKENGNQTGCEFTRLDKYIEQGRAKKNDGNTFYTIDTLCNFCRAEEWASGKLDRRSSVLKESVPKFDIVLWVDKHNEVDTRKTLEWLAATHRHIFYKRIHILLDHTEGDPNHYIDWLNHTFGENVGWTVRRAAPDIVGTHRSILDIVHDIYGRSNSSYVMVLRNGATLSENYFEDLNRFLNFDLTPVFWDRTDDSIAVYRALIPFVREFDLSSDYEPEVLTKPTQEVVDALTKPSSDSNNSEPQLS